ncbi:hypothetical protein phiLo_164 [Thermus phage phiLo]|nr:hypothetical protein phiLo_164 [Thermus phage phiLo]
MAKYADPVMLIRYLLLGEKEVQVVDYPDKRMAILFVPQPPLDEEEASKTFGEWVEGAYRVGGIVRPFKYRIFKLGYGRLYEVLY